MLSEGIYCGSASIWHPMEQLHNCNKKDVIWIIVAAVFIIGNYTFVVSQQNTGYVGSQLLNSPFIIERVMELGENPVNMTEFERLRRGIASSEVYRCSGDMGHEYPCQNYTVNFTSKSIKQLLEDRMTSLRSKCIKYLPYMFNASLSKHGSTENQRLESERKRVLVSTRLNLAYCWMPKMASTFMQYAWAPLNRAVMHSEAVHNADKSYVGLSHYTLNQFWNQEMKQRKENRFTSFTIARSPWRRLVSVYREKCEREDKSYLCKLDFGKNCYPRIGVKVTFVKFIQCVIDMLAVEKTEVYGHLETSYSRCGVCNFPYQYVVLMENFGKEIEYIFKEAGLLDPTRVMQTVRSRTIRTIEVKNKHISYVEYWRQVPPEMVEKIRFLYRYELALYDYPETPFIS